MSPMPDAAVDFDVLVAAHRRALLAHCYRMLGSVQDAEDALQEALLAAWRGLEGFEGRSSLLTWLYTVATNVCLRMISRRPSRRLTPDMVPPREDTADLGEVVRGPVWIEPWLDEPAYEDPAAAYERRERVELAFIAALQHLPGTQRAVLIMREALDLSAAEVAEALETTPASVNSALQRARQAVSSRMPAMSQAQELSSLGVDGQRELVRRFVTAWEAGDLDGVIALLAQDARFTMPPLPAWFDGRENVARFIRERVFATPWRLRPLRVNGQLGFACYILEGGSEEFHLGAVNVLTLRRARIAAIDGFLDPAVHRRMGLPERI